VQNKPIPCAGSIGLPKLPVLSFQKLYPLGRIGGNAGTHAAITTKG